MASLRGKSPKDTFGSLLHVSGSNATTTLQPIEDGLGNQLPVSISTSKVALHGMEWPTTGAAPGKALMIGDDGASLGWITPAQPVTQMLKANFTGPVVLTTGTSRFYPPTNITIREVYCSISTPGTSNVEVDVLVNGFSIFGPTRPKLLPGQHRGASVITAAQVLTSGYLTVDILQASGDDLVVYILY
jgi:hypothetical protein